MPENASCPAAANPPAANPPTANGPCCAGASRCRRVRSSDVLGADSEIEIQHGEALYRLRITSLGKLILTK